MLHEIIKVEERTQKNIVQVLRAGNIDIINQRCYRVACYRVVKPSSESSRVLVTRLRRFLIHIYSLDKNLLPSEFSRRTRFVNEYSPNYSLITC